MGIQSTKIRGKDRFLEISGLNHEETENLNRPTTGKEMKSVIQNLQQTNVQD